MDDEGQKHKVPIMKSIIYEHLIYAMKNITTVLHIHKPYIP